MVDKQELNKKLAEWAGFKKIDIFCGHCWDSPRGENIGGALPNFIQSPDACFKWLVPKVITTDGYSLEVIYMISHCETHIRPHYYGDKHYAGSHKEAAMSLCLAIEKLIDSES